MTSGKTTNIVFFGTEEVLSTVVLRRLLDEEYNVVAVVTRPDARTGRGQKLVAPVVKKCAQEYGIPAWQPAKLRDIVTDITALQPVAGVLVGYGKIIPQNIIDLFTPGIINVHPSALPRYRGPSPIEAALLHGDSETAVSIMQLSAEMDAGPVYACEPYSLTGAETQEELYKTLADFGAELLVEHLPSILDGTLQPTPQNDADATYCQLITKADSVLDWQKPAAQLERQVRAYHQWPGSRATIGSVDVIVTQAHVGGVCRQPAGTVHADNDELAIATSDHWLVIDRLKPLGKKEMPAGAFLAGYRNKL